MRPHALPPIVPAALTLLALAATPGARGRAAAAGRSAEDPVPAARLIALAQCGACHALGDPGRDLVARRMAPDLTHVAERLTPAGVRAFLLDPQGVRPGTRMPDLLGALPERDRADAAGALARFLVGDGADAGGAAPVALDLGTIEDGRQRYDSLGCGACHGAFESPASLERPLWQYDDPLAPPEEDTATGPAEWGAPRRLLGLSRLYSLDGLARFLADPLAARPYGLMPDQGLDQGGARAIAAYLLFEDATRAGTVHATRAPGLAYAYFEGDFAEEGPPAFDTLAPARLGTVDDLSALPPHREDRFGLRYTGFVEVPAEGEWTFTLRSDDGSWLWIDGAPVVADGGVHPPQDASGHRHLTAGTHTLEVRFFEAAGGEELGLSWEGPGTARAPIPSSALWREGLAFDTPSGTVAGAHSAAADRTQGEALFTKLGCSGCHALEGVPVRPAPPLAAVADGVRAARGCLADGPAPGLPRYPAAALGGAAGGLRAAARKAVEGALPASDAERVDLLLTTYRCTACHERAGVGGPTAEARAHFRIAQGVDLGEEGRLPPQLDRVGWKLKRDWLRRVLDEGTEVRPYMLTRMPRFGIQNVGALATLLPRIDRPAEEAQPPASGPEAIAAGRELLGTSGLGCIQCHDLAGYGGLGVPAVDLATTPRRLRWPWFRALLADPGALNMNTRMPAFWIDGKSPVEELCGGDPERQVEALWSVLALGDAIPLPKGLLVTAGEYEVTPVDVPVCVGVFWDGASARTTLVGFPERLHVAFDVENSRLDAAWRGRFFDARGTWYARGGTLERPPTDDVLRLPPGPPLAVLADPRAAWPTELGRAGGWRARGRHYDHDRRPVFLYANPALALTVEEQPLPDVRADGVWLRRSFRVHGAKPVQGLTLRALVAPEIRRAADGTWTTPDGVRLRLTGADGVVRARPGGAELLVPLDWHGTDGAELAVEETWEPPLEGVR